MNLLFATGNDYKFKEAKAILKGSAEMQQLKLELDEIQSLDQEAIARHKLEQVPGKYDNVVVDDTSLHINSLNGLPGPLIKWFIQTLGAEGIWNLVKDKDDRSAVASCIVGLRRGTRIRFFRGEVEGVIVSPKGSRFGWDPIFRPNGHDRTYAEMSEEEKNGLSHRSKAFEALKQFFD